MQKPKKSICIISFSPIYRDARVLRQIKYLSPFYHLTVIGYGEPHPRWNNVNTIDWNVVKIPERSVLSIAIEAVQLAFGRFKISFFEKWYWTKRHHRTAFEMAISIKCDAYHANDWEALPVAAEAARKVNAPIVFDAHEYAPLELENRWYWRFFKPAIIYFIHKYAPQVKFSITVASLISDRYKKEFGLDPTVILNAPEFTPTPWSKDIDFNNIRLIHHGGAIKDRKLEKMIRILPLCDPRYSLHFMLISNGAKYLKDLKKLANELAPGRVTFNEPVPPEEVVHRISEYDIGIYLLEHNNYNNTVALPNKFFDFIAAGLVVCIGPSPSMAEILQKYGCGVVVPSFNSHDVAKTLNQLTIEQLAIMRQASRKAIEDMNAEKEMSKLLDLYTRLFNPN